MNSDVAPEAVAGLLLLVARVKGDQLTVEKISGAFEALRKKGIDIEVALRYVPGGFYSEDIEAFVGHLASAGYADTLSGGVIVLNDGGVRICREVIRDAAVEHPKDLSAIIEALGIDVVALLAVLVDVRPSALRARPFLPSKRRLESWHSWVDGRKVGYSAGD